MGAKHYSLSFQATVSYRQIVSFLFGLIVLALLVRLTVAYTTVHFFDLSFYYDWSTGVAKDFFGAYNTIENLDYPPLFLFPLYLTGKLLEIPAIADFNQYTILALKGWQILFDTATIPLLYIALRGHGELLALAAAVFWAVNPSIIVNSSYWGQTDPVMMFHLLLAFFLLSGRKPVWAGFVMTLGCLMKFQSLYFAPLFALYLLFGGFSAKKILQTMYAGALTAFFIFLPFMLRSGWILPYDIYFGGFEQYPGATLNAFNLFGLMGLNYEFSDSMLFGMISCEHFSWIAILFFLMLLVYFYFTASEKSPWLLGFLFIQSIFLFTTRMHERYQIPSVLFSLAACVWHKSRGMFAAFLAVSVMTFLNQFMVLEMAFAGEEPLAWLRYFEEIMRVLSFVNLVLYALTFYAAVRVLYRKGHRPLLHGIKAAFSQKAA